MNSNIFFLNQSKTPVSQISTNIILLPISLYYSIVTVTWFVLGIRGFIYLHKIISWSNIFVLLFFIGKMTREPCIIPNIRGFFESQEWLKKKKYLLNMNWSKIQIWPIHSFLLDANIWLPTYLLTLPNPVYHYIYT